MERKWWTLVAVCVATFMLLLDITIVNVALPSIQKDLDSSLTDLQWVVDAYALGLAALILTMGALADRFGRRRIFVFGVTVFTFASLLCALATSPVFLNLARALQGVGGAAMFATSLALIAQEFSGRERGTAIGLWGATIGAAVAVGPLVGGVLTESLSWEWIFLVNVPIGIGAVTIAATRSGESRDPGALRLDWLGLVTFSGSLFLLNFGLLRGNAEGWGSGVIVGSLGAAVLLMVAFLLVERHGSRPMLDLALFRRPAFVGVSIGTFAIGSGMFAMFLYLTLYIQDILGYSPLQAGLRFLPLTVVAFFVSPMIGEVLGKVPTRAILGSGLALVSAGLLLMHGVSPDSSWTTLLAGFLVAGIGIGAANPSIASTALGVVPAARSGMASGINNTFRLGGVATGIAALGAIFQGGIDSRLNDQLGRVPAGLSDAVASGSTDAVIASAPPGRRAQLLDAANSAFTGSLNEILLVGAAVLVVGAVAASVLIRARDFHTEPVRAQPGEPASEPATA
jgi:EmrB/QacA subfamily drug resistance transporter